MRAGQFAIVAVIAVSLCGGTALAQGTQQNAPQTTPPKGDQSRELKNQEPGNSGAESPQTQNPQAQKTR